MDKLFKCLCLNWKDIERVIKESIVSDKCYVCRKKLKDNDFVEATSYWGSYRIGKHKECSLENDVIACQEIDADCNDCKHFKRGELEAKGIFSGHCKKFDKPTKAYPNFCSNYPCFEHRKK